MTVRKSGTRGRSGVRLPNGFGVTVHSCAVTHSLLTFQRGERERAREREGGRGGEWEWGRHGRRA